MRCALGSYTMQGGGQELNSRTADQRTNFSNFHSPQRNHQHSKTHHTYTDSFVWLKHTCCASCEFSPVVLALSLWGSALFAAELRQRREGKEEEASGAPLCSVSVVATDRCVQGVGAPSSRAREASGAGARGPAPAALLCSARLGSAQQPRTRTRRDAARKANGGRRERRALGGAGRLPLAALAALGLPPLGSPAAAVGATGCCSAAHSAGR